MSSNEERQLPSLSIRETIVLLTKKPSEGREASDKQRNEERLGGAVFKESGRGG
ncbi:hypothetical protein K0M31_000805, partial [Melipona bicolor]